MPDIPRVLGKRYEVGDLIGRGGMAQVHLGYDTRLSRTVAIKVLRTDLAQDPMFLARFRREAQSAAALNHPSIVAVYDTGEEQVSTETGKEISLPYIVMEYVKGRTVAALLADGDPVPIGEAVQIVVGVLSALEYSHHEGIIHRDIKPGNVMITPDAKVKVMDFGIARAIADSAATMTQTNSVVGTAQYLSPEQARGEVVDARSDLYSTGCLLYELLTGKPPFSGDSAVAVAYQHVSETPKPASQVAPDIPDAIDRVVMKSLAKQRDARYQSAAEFRNDLLSAARGEGVDAPSVTSWNMAPVAVFPPTQVAQAAPTTVDTATQAAAATTYAPAQTGTQEAVDEEKEKTRRKNRAMIWGGIALLVIALVAIIWAVLSGRDTEPTPTTTTTTATVTQVEVPRLTGMTESEVEEALEAAGLEFRKGNDVASDTVEEGLFVSSSPSPGDSVDPGTTVTVHFSSGSSSVDVPDLSGMTTEQAASRLQEYGLTLGGTTTVDDPSQPKDRIVSQTPNAGSSAQRGDSVTVTVASGNVIVPTLVGLSESDATAALNALNLNVNTRSETVSDSSRDGIVLSASANEGDTVSQGSSVTITVGQYTEPSTEPEPSEPTEDPTPSDG